MTNAIRLAGRKDEPTLQVLNQPADGPPVVYIHGATFPAALSVAYAIDGRSWMDDLNARGFDAWAFDFAGYGGSDRPTSACALGRAVDVVPQIERVVSHILKRTGRERFALIAHSWGTIPAGMFAACRADAVERLVLFGPIAERKLPERPPTPNESARLISAADQWRAFQWGVPEGNASPIAQEIFDKWAQAYLATDPESAMRTPHAVLIPGGPDHDLADAWTEAFPYDPGDIRAPTLILRGEWNPLTTDDDAVWLQCALRKAKGGVRDVKLPRGAHRMHLEKNRQSLFDAAGAFLTEAV